MACSEIEMWLSILGGGMTGLRLLKDYDIRTPELEYFIKNWDFERIEISAFAPSPLRDQYDQLFIETKEKLESGVKKVANSDVSDAVLDKTLKDAKELYSLLSDLHTAIASGFIAV